MKLEITKNEYEILIEFFKLHDVEVNIRQVLMDEMLVALGFAEKSPCVVELDISEEEIDRIREICNDYDIAACNSEDSLSMKLSYQKLKMMYLVKMLMEKTDEEHTVTVPEMIAEHFN